LDFERKKNSGTCLMLGLSKEEFKRLRELQYEYNRRGYFQNLKMEEKMKLEEIEERKVKLDNLSIKKPQELL
jgi:hypothetical protein